MASKLVLVSTQRGVVSKWKRSVTKRRFGGIQELTNEQACGFDGQLGGVNWSYITVVRLLLVILLQSLDTRSPS